MRKRLLGLLGSAAIVVAACGPSAVSPSVSPGASAPPASAPASVPPSEPPFDAETALFGTTYEPEAGTDGGQIIFGDWQEATEFNPYYLGQVTEANVASTTFATLHILTHDFKYAGDLATEIPTTFNGGVKVPGDGGDAMTVTWTLRDGLKWSDGEALTCDDFLFTQDWVLDEENIAVIKDGFNVSTAECASDTSLVLHYSEIFEGYISQWPSPLPRHYLEDIPMADQLAHAGFRAEEVPDLPTSGAFKFESVTSGSEIRLVKNPNYVSWKTGKPAHLDRLIFKWYGDAAALIAGYRAGEVDFATDLAESDVPGLADISDQLSAIPALLYEFLRPNWADGPAGEDGVGGCSRNPAVQDRGDGCPMSDPAMREAIAWAIDKERINQQILTGNAQVANTSITPSAWFFADQPATTYDPEKAKSILDAAGWTVGTDGIREKDGLKAKIELCTTTLQRRQDTLALLASWLGDVGIEAVPNPVSATDIFAGYNEATIDTPCALSRSNFDLAEHAFSSSIDPLGGYFSYHSSQFEPEGANDAQVSDPALDAAFDTVKGSVDFVVIKEAMAEVQKVFAEKTVEIPLYYRKAVELHNAKLGNFFANGTQAGPTWNAVDWFVKG
ncbi:MAG TPA: peptide ABC transporter substrate-binding protein [Candidatus Limnocylindrales bacterium]|jgi:peptide/nickel transport system substrate-binding protein|nr:peptide ABC transporter substrate-binding protein [Candidatus Limnocylindrales bacterium]